MTIPILVATLMVFPAPNPQAPDAAAVIQKHVEARGGQARWDALTSVKRTCRSDYFEFTGLWAGHRARFDQTESNGSRAHVSVADGRSGWTSTESGVSTLNAEDALDVRNDAAAGFELFEHAALGLTITVRPTETRGTGTVHRLRLLRKSGAVIDVLIDAKTGLEVGRVRTIASPDGSVQELYSEVAQYQQHGGILFPSVMGGCSATWAVNIPAPANLFERPR